MKAFRKAWRTISATDKLHIKMDTPNGLTKEQIAEMIWKAALEWTLKEVLSTGHTRDEYEEIINKELKHD